MFHTEYLLTPTLVSILLYHYQGQGLVNEMKVSKPLSMLINIQCVTYKVNFIPRCHLEIFSVFSMQIKIIPHYFLSGKKIVFEGKLKVTNIYAVNHEIFMKVTTRNI